MGIRELERIFNEHAYPVILYDQKSEREAIKQFEEIDLNIKHLNKISRPFDITKLSSDIVRMVVMEIINKGEKGDLLTLDDLKRIREILQPGYLPLQEKYLRGLEQFLKVDVERKREIYAKDHGVEWDRTLDPQKELKEYSTDLPLIERLKIYLKAEACAEFALRNFPLWKEFLDEGKISYNDYKEKSIKIFQEIFGTLSV
jgi:hypothetical protein